MTQLSLHHSWSRFIALPTEPSPPRYMRSGPTKPVCTVTYTHSLLAPSQTTTGDNNTSQPLYLLGGKGEFSFVRTSEPRFLLTL